MSSPNFFVGYDIIRDIKQRLPLYLSDWKEGWACGYRILAPSLYIFFASVLPALAFGQQLAMETQGQLTVVHVLTSTALAGVLQSVIGGQPLLIIGVAEPIVIIYGFLYSFVRDEAEIGPRLFLPWCAWVCVWTGILCIVVALSGACRLIDRFTRFSGELFGMLIAILFLQQAVKVSPTLSPCSLSLLTPNEQHAVHSLVHRLHCIAVAAGVFMRYGWITVLLLLHVTGHCG